MQCLAAVHCQGIPLKCGVGPHPSTRLEGAFGQPSCTYSEGGWLRDERSNMSKIPGQEGLIFIYYIFIICGKDTEWVSPLRKEI